MLITCASVRAWTSAKSSPTKGYEVEATRGFDQVELVFRKGDTRSLRMTLPKDHDLSSFAAGVLVGVSL